MARRFMKNDFYEGLRPAKIIRIRELTELGSGYPPEMLGIDEGKYLR